MTTAVVYYTFEQNTERVAERISSLVGADLYRITCEDEPPKAGPMKFISGGRQALRHETPTISIAPIDYGAYDRIVLAGPVWASTYAPAMGSYLRELPFSGKTVYLVGCSSSGNATKMFAQLEEMLAGNTVAAELSLRNPGRIAGELAKVDGFCDEYLK